MRLSTLSTSFLSSASLAWAQYSVYQPQYQVIYNGLSTSVTTTATAASATYSGSAAYDTTVLSAPAVPNPAPATSFNIQLYSGGMTGLSIPQNGGFFGFSIEMSVVNHVLGSNSSVLQVPFLNLMANIQQRVGWVQVRVGGNTQESAVLVASLANNSIISKDYSAVSGTTNTPPLDYTPEVFYMMGNISALTNVRWYLGVPFFNTTPFDLSIVSSGQAILGDYLLAFQAGNEPDLYTDHGDHRVEGYSPYDYYGEIDDLITQAASDSSILKNDDVWIIPSVATGDWTPEVVWDTGIVGNFSDHLNALAVEHYPTDNCAAQFNTGGTIVNPQDVFPEYLNHTSGQAIVAPYINTANTIAQPAGKPFIMFETNTASCGGFAGVSNSFGAALWALDYAMTMAYSNFTGALFHTGGQNAYYNPFTPPPTNQSSFKQWSVGATYYSALVMAEVLGPSNASQLIDLGANDNSIYTPGYAIYENGTPTKLALFNYITDSSGASDYTATVAIGGSGAGQDNATPSSVRVKYLRSSSVADIQDFTWAGQTFGASLGSDGRLTGDLDVQTVNCDTSSNTCQIKVPAPSFALVFLTDDAYSSVTPTATETFPTTVFTKTVNTLSIDMSVLETSNGHVDMEDVEAATSAGSSGAERTRGSIVGMGVVGTVAVAVAGWIFMGAAGRL